MRAKDEKKRQAIYKAALEHITEHGLAHTSIAKIAKQANVSPATIYVYFENKQDMLDKLYLKLKEDSTAVLFEGITEDLDVREGLAIYMRNLFAYMLANPLQFLFLQQFYHSPNISEEYRAAGESLYKPMLELYYQGVEAKMIKDYPIELMSAFIKEPIFSLVKAHHNNELKVNQSILEKAIEMTWMAVKY